MSRRPSVYTQKALHQWTEELAGVFPELSKPQVAGLAGWSFGMVLARCCALTAVAFSLAKLLGQKVNTARQRLREFYQEADAKKGEHRRDLDITTCFAPLLRWLLRDWQGQQLALAVDASTLGTLFVVLCVSVVYRGCAIPVAWKVLPATAQGSWKEPWLHLLEQFHGLVPEGWTVIVMADRGLWAKWLFEGIRNLGWHPLLRINQGGKFRPQGWLHFVPLARLAPCVGSRWRGRGTAFATATAQLACTLLVFWGEGHKEAWLVLTDLPPELSDASWYSLRTWIEQFFKDSKRGGWQWQRTRMTDPARAERLWLAVAVATLWLVRLGGADEVAEATAATTLSELQLVSDVERPKTRRWRLVSVFARGWTVLLVALINHERLPLGQLVPEPWPVVPQLPEPTQIPSETPCVA
jgi:Transposase DDE domain